MLAIPESWRRIKVCVQIDRGDLSKLEKDEQDAVIVCVLRLEENMRGEMDGQEGWLKLVFTKQGDAQKNSILPSLTFLIAFIVFDADKMV